MVICLQLQASLSNILIEHQAPDQITLLESIYYFQKILSRMQKNHEKNFRSKILYKERSPVLLQKNQQKYIKYKVLLTAF